ncbi:uracil-DNA glycosylase family protein [Dictyobacter arantiisoli]|uniref:Uracil-DNA glycosylase n=1 Tax=Dictyobacter arantiisoli TaxID=2014874 RepID=A0A5A5TEL4_9CHLR|nr:uracil-DNA glycosylase family protein [Dictyobacter arantiisoli]GCF09586.1 uracil-DNA glycosylase [Dictyobacter arantiisoli]
MLKSQPEAGKTRSLHKLQQRIRTCQLCQQQGYIPVAHPIVSGQATNRIMVIGQAPGHRSVEQDLPFSGPAGRILQTWLEMAGFPAGYLHEHTYLSSLTRCDPGPNIRGNGDRKPSPAEMALCRPYLDAELLLLHPQIVLLVGTMAIEAFLGKTTLEHCVGTYQKRQDTYYLPLPHPSGVSRWLNDPEHKKLHQQALHILAHWRNRYNL